MLSILLSYVIILAKVLGVLILLEVLFIRVIPFLRGYRFYKNQGIPFFKGLYPFVGNFFEVCELMSEHPK